MENNTATGIWIPCLKEGESNYTFTPQELSALVRKAFKDGYDYAKTIYDESAATSTHSWDAVEETHYGTH